MLAYPSIRVEKGVISTVHLVGAVGHERKPRLAHLRRVELPQMTSLLLAELENLLRELCLVCQGYNIFGENGRGRLTKVWDSLGLRLPRLEGETKVACPFLSLRRCSQLLIKSSRNLMNAGIDRERTTVRKRLINIQGNVSLRSLEEQLIPDLRHGL